ncbi:MAG TPA: hypothetical protein VK907_09210, partial [Phnomibacter sp.]|nr:hypothetical protein [Phnomibacter sp.]
YEGDMNGNPVRVEFRKDKLVCVQPLTGLACSARILSANYIGGNAMPIPLRVTRSLLFLCFV